MRAIDKLEQQLREAAARELESERSRAFTFPKLPWLVMPVAGALAVLLVTLFVVVPALRGPTETEREVAAPKATPVQVPADLLGSFRRGEVTLIFDFDRYTILSGEVTVRGDAESVPAGLRLTHDGAGDCGTAPQEPGVYAYRFRGDALTFTALDDDCAARRRALTGGPFRRGG